MSGRLATALAPAWLGERMRGVLRRRSARRVDRAAAYRSYAPFFRSEGQIVEAVAAELPPQPWPTGTHKKIAAKLSLSHQKIGRAIDELIRQGRCFPQIDGRVYEPRREDSASPQPTTSRSTICRPSSTS